MRAMAAGRPEFGFPEGKLALAVAALDRGLAGIGTPMALEIQLAHIPVFRQMLALHVLKEGDRGVKMHLGRAFDILFPGDLLQVVPGGAAAAVAVAKGQQKRVQMFALHPVVPFVDDGGRVDLGFILHVQEALDLAAVHALPGEVMVGETVRSVVCPEDLLGGEVVHPAAL